MHPSQWPLELKVAASAIAVWGLLYVYVIVETIHRRKP